MSYQVTLNSRNVLVPIALEEPRGERLGTALAKMDTATAMVILVSSGGDFSQEIFPLRIVKETSHAYSGQAWELWEQKAGGDRVVHYLGIPDSFFAAGTGGSDPKSISVQVVGTSPLTGKEDFAGGVDVTLQAQVGLPLIPGFLNLGERFFPTLLPHNFVAGYVVDTFAFQGKRRLVLMASLQSDPSDRIPVSLGKHWDPKSWIGAVVENLWPSGGPGGYFTIAGGCFFSRNRKITHWFGGRIGPEETRFREAASGKIRTMGSSGAGAWVFWLEPQGSHAPDPDVVKGEEGRTPQPRFSIRHPMMHLLLHHGPGEEAGRLQSQLSFARLSAPEAISALCGAARIMVDFQGELHKAMTEPSYVLWSDSRGGPSSPLVSHPSDPALSGAGRLESAVRALYRAQGDALRTLEAAFDETYGYAAWDAVGDPMREILSAYMAETQARSGPGS